MKRITLAQLAEKLGGELLGDPDRTVSGVGPLHTAGPDEVSFLANPRYAAQFETATAGAVIVSPETRSSRLNLVRVPDPYYGFALAMEIFYSEPYTAEGVNGNAVVHPDAVIGEEPSIHPLAVIGAGATLGSRVTVMSCAVIGPGATVGDGSTIHPNVVLERDVRVGADVVIHAGTVVGSDGFGFARDGEKYKKIQHAGTVVIEDEVEIGAGCTIDRAVLGETVVGRGSRLDNLIQVGHNVRIGPNCVIVAQAGLAGSTELGNNVTMAGQSGVAGHLKIGSGAVIMGRSSVFKDLPPGAVVAGTPAMDAGEWKKASAVFARLDNMRKKVARLEKELSALLESDREEDTL